MCAESDIIEREKGSHEQISTESERKKTELFFQNNCIEGANPIVVQSFLGTGHPNVLVDFTYPTLHP